MSMSRLCISYVRKSCARCRSRAREPSSMWHRLPDFCRGALYGNLLCDQGICCQSDKKYCRGTAGEKKAVFMSARSVRDLSIQSLMRGRMLFCPARYHGRPVCSGSPAGMRLRRTIIVPTFMIRIGAVLQRLVPDFIMLPLVASRQKSKIRIR